MPEASLCTACPDYIVNWGGRGWLQSAPKAVPGRPARVLTQGGSRRSRGRARPVMPPTKQPPTPAPGSAGSTVIVGGSDETRLLLRGLLRLYHYRVEGEVPRAEFLKPAPAGGEGRVLILVVDGPGDEWPSELATARERQPSAQPLLIARGVSAQFESTARSAGVRGILYHPYAIHDLISTVEAVRRGELRFAPNLPQR